jgi:hypothetical protein
MVSNNWLKSYLDVADTLVAAGISKAEAECLLHDAYENGAAQTIAGLITCVPHHDHGRVRPGLLEQVGYKLDTSALQQPYAGDGVFADND